MSSESDSLEACLGIPRTLWPPHHYLLLGLAPFESNSQTIALAAQRRIQQVCSFQTPTNLHLVASIVNMIQAARDCLLIPDKKRSYDECLRRQATSFVLTMSASTLSGILKTSSTPHLPRLDEASRSQRIFYLNDFIYFLESVLKTRYRSQPEFLLEYLTYLLLIFDRILLSGNHLNVSGTEDGKRFKKLFFSQRFSTALVDTHRIVVSIWDACNDIPTFVEASTRYAVECGFLHNYNSEIITTLQNLQVLGRKPDRQGESTVRRIAALVASDQLRKEVDSLRYEDSGIVLPFSTERLLLGHSRGVLPKPVQKAAAEMYVEVMPIGNGRLYRASAPGYETFEHPIALHIPQKEFINPFFLDPDTLRSLFVTTLKFRRVNSNHFGNDKWVSAYLALLDSGHVARFRESLIRVLCYASVELYGRLEDLFRKSIRIRQSLVWQPKLIAAGLQAFCDETPAKGMIEFLGRYFHEMMAAKHFWVSPRTREEFNEIWESV